MSKIYTITDLTHKVLGKIYTVLTDRMDGFDSFIADHIDDALPGTTVDVADLRKVFRLRHDGNWDVVRDYAAESGVAISDDDAVAAVLDGLLTDEELGEVDT